MTTERANAAERPACSHLVCVCVCVAAADVRAPTLIVHAADDPIIPEVSVRRWLRDASPAVRVAWSARGGG